MTPLLTFRVQAVDGGGKVAMTTFTLSVLDVNDNAPTFQQGSFHSLPISELTQVPLAIYIYTHSQ